MKTSKLTSIYILLGVLILTSILSIPVQAKAIQPGKEQLSSELAGKPATKTRRPKSTPIAKKTATPKPANTTTNAPDGGNTSMPTVSATPSVTVTSAFSPTPTAFGTAAAHYTQTAVIVALTSTSSALTASPTPTNFGGASSTPDAAALTATSWSLTMTPVGENGQASVISSSGSSGDPQIPLTSGQPVAKQTGKKIFWMLEVGLVFLLLLFYLLGRELKKKSPKSR